jgi:hypothetical protein
MLLKTLAQTFTLEVPFSHVRNDHAIAMRTVKGERPLKPISCENIGFSDDLWDVMEQGWASSPDSRPFLSAFFDVLGS